MNSSPKSTVGAAKTFQLLALFLAIFLEATPAVHPMAGVVGDRQGPQTTQDQDKEGNPKRPGGDGGRPPATAQFVLYREPIQGLTTERREVAHGELIPLTNHSALRLTISQVGVTGASVSYRWKGARPVVGSGIGSRAEFSSRRPGLYTVRVTPGIPDAESIEVRIKVFAIHPERIRVSITDPPGQFTYVGHPFTCQAATDPAEFANLVEWSAPDHKITSGVGPTFETSRDIVGDQFPITASLASTPHAPVARMMVYRAYWLKQPGIQDYFAAPTVRLFFQVATDPPGYEKYVHWDFMAMGTAAVFPETGQGGVFITTVTPRNPGRLWRGVEADNLVVEGDLEEPLFAVFDEATAGERESPQSTGSTAPGYAFRLPVKRCDKDGGCWSPGGPGGIPSTLFTGIAEQLPPQTIAADYVNLTDGSHAGAIAGESESLGLFNGQIRLQQSFLRVDSLAFPFDFTCTYLSRATYYSALGYNWMCSYNDRRAYLIPDGSGNVSVVDGMGREDVYLSQGGGAFTSPAGIYDTLVRNGNGTYTQVNAAGDTFQYNLTGTLISITDSNGNTMSFLRDAFNNISQITDTQGRVYTLTYTVAGGAEKLASLTDFDGRQVLFTRNGNGDLTQVRSPLVTGTPNGNDFPLGKTLLYTYSSGFADVRLNHNLLSAIESQYNIGNNPALSRSKLAVTYSSSTDPDAVDFDHIVSVRHGNDQGMPTPGPDVVGGTLSFAHTRPVLGDSDAPPATYSRTTLTDENGNTRASYFDVSRHQIRHIERTNRSVRPGEGDFSDNYLYAAEGLVDTITQPRTNSVKYLYDPTNPRRQNQWNPLEERRKANGVGGGGTDLVTRYTYEPVFNQVRTVTDPRGFPTGVPPLDVNGHLDLNDPTVMRYTTTTFFDYQEGSGFQSSQGIPLNERIPEGLGDLNLDGLTTQTKGNPVKVVYPTIQTPGPNFGQTASMLQTWNTNGQPLKTTDREGHATLNEYFPHAGAANDPSDREGYLKSVTRDSGGLNLRTQYEYDQRGNLTREIDPKGQDTLHFYNQLDQRVRTLSRIAFGTTRYQEDFFYTANDDLDHVETQNLDETGTPYAHNPI